MPGSLRRPGVYSRPLAGVGGDLEEHLRTERAPRGLDGGNAGRTGKEVNAVSSSDVT